MKIYIPTLLFVIGLTLSSALPARIKREPLPQRGRFFGGQDFKDGLAGFAGGYAGSYFLNQLLCGGRSAGRSSQTAQIGAGLGFALGALTSGCG